MRCSAKVVETTFQEQQQAWNISVGRIESETLSSRTTSIPLPADGDARSPLQLDIKRIEMLRKDVVTLPSSPVPRARRQCQADRSSLKQLAKGSTAFTESGELSGIHDFEQSILDMWRLRESTAVKCKQLCEWMEDYAAATDKVVKRSDLVGHSRRLVVGAAMAALCDMLTTKQCPCSRTM